MSCETSCETCETSLPENINEIDVVIEKNFRSHIGQVEVYNRLINERCIATSFSAGVSYISFLLAVFLAVLVHIDKF